MLEEKIELLYNTINERTRQWEEYRKLFGKDHFLTESIFDSMRGLEEVFELISGRSYTEVLIEKCKKAMVA